MCDKPSYEELEQRIKGLKKEAEHLRQVEQQLIRANERLQYLLSSTSAVIYTASCSADYGTTFVGENVTRLSGYRPRQFVEDPGFWIDHIHPEDSPRVLAELPLIFENGSHTCEYRFRRKDGVYIWVRDEMRLVRNENGIPLELSGIWLEITDAKLMEQALKKTAHETKLFACSVSHDLRSPAIGIYGLTRLLNRHCSNALDNKAKDYCDQIMRAAEQVASLAEMINVYISSKEAPLNMEQVKLNEVIQMVKDEFSTRLNIRQIDWLQIENMQEIKADRLSLLRILRNLVDNALKHGGEDLTGIKLGYKESNEFHVLSVANDGITIKISDPDKLFGLFHRHETPGKVEGAGLGLAIVKELAQRHGGKVWMESGPGKWTVFSVSISKNL